MDFEAEPVSITQQDLMHKQAVRLILEDVVYAPTRLIYEREDDGWVKRGKQNYEEDHRTELKMEGLYEGDSEEAETKFEQALFRLKATTLTQSELKELAVAITYGLQTMVEATPLEGSMVNTILRNTLSEIAHSMNRKGLVSNDDVGTFLADMYTEMKV